MVKEKVNCLMDKFGNEITEEQSRELKREFETADDEKYEALLSLKNKSPKLTVILSAVLGLFGAGSFYLGYIKIGVIKVALNVVLPLILGLTFLYWLAPLHKEYTVQTSDLISALNENIEYDYEYDDFVEDVSVFNSSYTNYNKIIPELYGLRENFAKANAYLNEISSEDQNDFLAFKTLLSNLDNYVSVSTLSVRVEEALIALNELSGEEGASISKAEQEKFKGLTDRINKISSSADYITQNLSVADFQTELEDLNAKIQTLKDATTFEGIFAALDSMSVAYLNNVGDNFENLKSYFETLSNSATAGLIADLKSLNNRVFEFQKNNETNTVEQAEETPLGVAITEFSEKYVAPNEDAENETAFLQIKLRSGTDKNIPTVSKFIEDFISNCESILQTVKIVYAKTYEGEKGVDISKSIKAMKSFNENFTDDYIDFFEYMNDGYVNNLRQINKKLSEAKADTVEKEIILTQTLTEIITVLKELPAENDINNIQLKVIKIVNNITGLKVRTQNCYDDWFFSYRFQNMYIGTILIVCGTIILAYWIGEVFGDRERCYKLNYENIKKLIR